MLPDDADITKVVLSIYFRHGTVGIQYTTAHRLERDWDASAVTWLKADGNADWTSDGGDYSDENKVTLEYAGASSWEEYDVTDIVKEFVAGTPNYGFFIIPDEADGNTGRNYISSDNTDSDSLRPKLTITYESTAIHHNTIGTAGMQNIIVNKSGPVVKLFVPFENSYQIVFYNASGSTVKEIQSRGEQWYSITNESLSKGLYFVRILSDGKKLTGKYVHIE